MTGHSHACLRSEVGIGLGESAHTADAVAKNLDIRMADPVPFDPSAPATHSANLPTSVEVLTTLTAMATHVATERIAFFARLERIIAEKPNAYRSFSERLGPKFGDAACESFDPPHLMTLYRTPPQTSSCS